MGGQSMRSMNLFALNLSADPSRTETADFPQGDPSIRPREERGLLGMNEFSDLLSWVLVRSPRVAGSFRRRIEGRSSLSTLPTQGETGSLRSS